MEGCGGWGGPGGWGAPEEPGGGGGASRFLRGGLWGAVFVGSLVFDECECTLVVDVLAGPAAWGPLAAWGAAWGPLAVCGPLACPWMGAGAGGDRERTTTLCLAPPDISL